MATEHAETAYTLDSVQLYTLAEISKSLDITTRTLLTYIKNGKLKAVKLGGKWRVSGDNLRSFINGGESE